MKLGIFSTFIADYTFPETCKLLAALGFDGIQPRIVARDEERPSLDPTIPVSIYSNRRGTLFEDDFFKDPKGVLAPAFEAGLEISSVASYTCATDMPRVVSMLKACQKAGIRNVRVDSHKLPLQGMVDMAAWVDRSRGQYREVVQEAKKCNVRPMLELHGSYPHTCASGMVDFLRGFDPADMGIHYSPATINEGRESPRLSLNYIGPYLTEVHMRNCKWVRQGYDAYGCRKWGLKYCHADEGVVNWPEIIKQLKIVGYDGWLVDEPYAYGSDTYTRLRRTHNYLRRLMNEPNAGVKGGY